MTALSKKIRLQVFKKYISLTYTILFGLYSFISIFIPIDAVIKDYSTFSIWKKGILLLIFALTPLLFGSFISCIVLLRLAIKNKATYSLCDGNNAMFIVEYGDLHKYLFPSKPPKQRYTVVIPVSNQLNRIFDDWETLGRSIHGYWIKEVKEHPEKHSNITLKQLSAILQNCIREKYPKEFKQDPNTKYTIGNGILIRGEVINVTNVDYYFLASNMLNDKDYAYYEGDSQETIFLTAIQGLVDACTKELNQHIIYMPVIGGGFAGMKKTQTELISFIYELFKFNGIKIKSDIHVIIYRTQKSSVSIFLE